MQKILFIFIAALFPFMTSHAQLGTGGFQMPHFLLHPKYRKMSLAKDTIKEMEKRLVARDAKCAPANRLIKTNDLIQSYLKLSLFKNPSSSIDKCNQVNRYFACMNDKEFKVLANDLMLNSQAPNVLMQRYKISEPEAKRIIMFFHKLGKKVK